MRQGSLHVRGGSEGSPPALVLRARAFHAHAMNTRYHARVADDPVHPPAERSDRSPWNWLLLVPIIIPLLTFVYNDIEPRLFGFPRFYWLQLAYIGLGIVCTAIVYRATRRKPPAAPEMLERKP